MYLSTRERSASRESRSATASAAEPDPPPISTIVAGRCLGRELAEEPRQWNLRPRRVGHLGDGAGNGRAAAEEVLEAELVYETQEHPGREAVEVLAAEDEFRREERPDGGVRNPRQKGREVFVPARHGAILSSDVKLFLSMKTVFTAITAITMIAIGRQALAAGASEPRVVVLGFDGVDSQIVEQMLAAGRL